MNKKLLQLLLIAAVTLLPRSSICAQNISQGHFFAWSDNVGYINFSNIQVDSDKLTGYAWSENAGWINFNPNEGGVKNDGQGNLSGNAWGEQLGWVNFDNVNINTSNGKFSGLASGTLIGTLTFDCPNYCDVETSWRPDSHQDSGGGYISPSSQPSQSLTTAINPEIKNTPTASPKIDNLIKQETKLKVFSDYALLITIIIISVLVIVIYLYRKNKKQ